MGIISRIINSHNQSHSAEAAKVRVLQNSPFCFSEKELKNEKDFDFYIFIDRSHHIHDNGRIQTDRKRNRQINN